MARQRGRDGKWRRVEALAAQIERALGPEAQVTANERILDRDGNLAEADICVRHEAGGRTYVTVVEVRDRGRPASRPWVDEVIGKWCRAGVDKTVLVSTSGFTPAALRKAKSFNIEALTFGEVDTERWSIVFALTHIEMHNAVARLDQATIDLDAPILAQPPDLRIPLDFNAPIFRIGEGEPVSPYHLWRTHFWHQQPEEERYREAPPRTEEYVLRAGPDGRIDVWDGAEWWPVGALRMCVTYWVEVTRHPFLRAREMAGASDGHVRAGIVETVEPVPVAGQPAYIGLVYRTEVVEGASRPDIAVVVRPADR